jgi:hypothetical protein
MPSHSGQCWLHKALIFVPVVVSLAAEAAGIQA